ncbi:hypothetical protein [Virgisporangium aurantiacum]|uniref:hypothetical protein n=1 Tax=Virgisporangium aurantiacum TaxID=175570 RepID=UPI00194FBA15|nr:hypothetical protein [Virgisporangium aurantiacum]
MTAAIDALERRSGLRVPAAVREWYAVRDASAWLRERRGNVLVDAHDLGRPLNGVDYLGRGRLATETDCQFCCRWVVRLPAARDGTQPLFPLPQPSPVEVDDPPVFLVDPEDADSHEDRYADRFTTYVLTSVWDAHLPAEAVSDFDRPLPPDALPTLRRRFPELPATYAWAGNQDCEAMYRFDGAARILLAVKGPIMVYAVVATDDPATRAEVLATLGLAQPS